jgi:hypothetical protein
MADSGWGIWVGVADQTSWEMRRDGLASRGIFFLELPQILLNLSKVAFSHVATAAEIMSFGQ